MLPKLALATTLAADLLPQGTAGAATGSADPSVSVGASAEPTTATSDLIYTITLTNNGPDPSASTNIHDTLPSEVMLMSVGGAGRYDPSLNKVTWHLGTLDAGRVAVRTVVIRPIHPKKITNSVTVTTMSSDPTTPNTVDTLSHVVGEPGVEYISMRDTGIQPPFRDVALGGTLQWDSFGPGVHEITDSQGLGVFDSGPTTAVNYFRYTFDLSAEIRTMDIGYPDNNGKVVVPVQVSPSSGDLLDAVHRHVGSVAPAGGFRRGRSDQTSRLHGVADVSTRNAGAQRSLVHRRYRTRHLLLPGPDPEYRQ